MSRALTYVLETLRIGGDKMAWPYHFVDLDSEQTLLRRKLLDRYGAYAQLSSLVPLLAYQLFRISVWATSRVGGYTSSPGARRENPADAMTRLRRRVLWWFEGEAWAGWGLRAHWIIGALWASWLIFLSVDKTGNDYLHVTKRIGIVAASQFPMHYLLSMKSLYSPVAFAFRCSHEQLNPYHRILGRIIYSLLILHGGLYINFYIQKGLLWERLSSQVPFLGLSGLSLLTLLVSSSLAIVRRWSYRVFFVLHLTIAGSIFPVLFFHASPIRLYGIESLAIFILDLLARKLDTVTVLTTITPLLSTKLIKLYVEIPPSKIYRFMLSPGQHIYLSIPPQSWPDKITVLPIRGFLYNPFTVADVTPNGITIVLRTQHGPTTTALSRLVTISKPKLQISIEGPYGGSQYFPEFGKGFDRVLLVAGGVGATFILPVYHSIRQNFGRDGVRGDHRVKLIWIMRSAAEMAWAENLSAADEDEDVEMYVTRSKTVDNPNPAPLPGNGAFGIESLRTVHKSILMSSSLQRPNLRRIVDETFRHRKEDRVAVIVCGPVGMAWELRRHVGRWVQAGRYVWWHNESFGW